MSDILEAQTGRPLDLSTLLEAHPEHENALMAFLCHGIGAPEHAACDALRFLAAGWADDNGVSRSYMLGTLKETIETLQRMEQVILHVVAAQDCLDAARDLLVSQPVAQTSSRVRDLLAAHDEIVQRSGVTPETHAALVGLLVPPRPLVPRARRGDPVSAYLCVSDVYTPSPEVYASVEDFQSMCLASFGERATLTPRNGEDEWLDHRGLVVLRRLPEPAEVTP